MRRFGLALGTTLLILSLGTPSIAATLGAPVVDNVAILVEDPQRETNRQYHLSRPGTTFQPSAPATVVTPAGLVETTQGQAMEMILDLEDRAGIQHITVEGGVEAPETPEWP